ncbi:hypothetical protein IAQ61_006101 [Plenodomus lingam]|uniref:uncharacterized protein n=1 Tax=Leptosphaeria maculans TaxID=5022 RepID=UPI00331FB6FC|nr:hypothetical protein IAQ61_006101 [Plenodomus lingam]
MGATDYLTFAVVDLPRNSSIADADVRAEEKVSKSLLLPYIPRLRHAMGIFKIYPVGHRFPSDYGVVCRP